jgi:hypothetical protein
MYPLNIDSCITTAFAGHMASIQVRSQRVRLWRTFSLTPNRECLIDEDADFLNYAMIQHDLDAIAIVEPVFLSRLNRNWKPCGRMDLCLLLQI